MTHEPDATTIDTPPKVAALPTTHASPTSDAAPVPVGLPDDLADCHRMIVELLEALKSQRHEADGLRHRLDELLRRLYGKRSEKFDPRQLLLFPELLEALGETALPEPAAAVDPNNAEANDAKARKPGHGRKRLPEHLPREVVVHDLTEAEKICGCCGLPLVKIGEETSEQLDYTPAVFKVIVHTRCKYAHPQPAQPGCDLGVVRADLPPQAIDKGLPAPGLLAHVIVSKYADHLPLYRLEGIFERVGVEVSRQTMVGWTRYCAELLAPIYRRMVERIKQSRKIHTDDTTVPVLEPGRGETKTGRLWVYLGDDDHPYTVFDYTPNRKRDGPADWLKGFAGFLHADAFSGYDGIYLDAEGSILECACWAHARRKFFESRTSDPAAATHALALIGQLYEVERAAKKRADEYESAHGAPMTPEHFHALRLELRTEHARPVMDRFWAWLDAAAARALPKSPIGQAIGYARNQRAALQRYLDDGIAEIDNNAAERAIKNVVIGRKNWLFAGSDSGGATAATLFSLTVTCKRLAINPWAYLKDVLDQISTHPAKDLDALLPDRWAQAASNAAAQ